MRLRARGKVKTGKGGRRDDRRAQIKRRQTAKEQQADNRRKFIASLDTDTADLAREEFARLGLL